MDTPESLTKRQRLWLEAVLQNRGTKPSDFRVLARLLVKGWFPYTAAFVVAALLHWVLDAPSAALVFAGVPLGILIVYLDLAAASAETWPLMNAVIDWPKVDEMAASAMSEQGRANQSDGSTT